MEASRPGAKQYPRILAPSLGLWSFWPGCCRDSALGFGFGVDSDFVNGGKGLAEKVFKLNRFVVDQGYRERPIHEAMAGDINLVADLADGNVVAVKDIRYLEGSSSTAFAAE